MVRKLNIGKHASTRAKLIQIFLMKHPSQIVVRKKVQTKPRIDSTAPNLGPHWHNARSSSEGNLPAEYMLVFLPLMDSVIPRNRDGNSGNTVALGRLHCRRAIHKSRGRRKEEVLEVRKPTFSLKPLEIDAREIFHSSPPPTAARVQRSNSISGQGLRSSGEEARSLPSFLEKSIYNVRVP